MSGFGTPTRTDDGMMNHFFILSLVHNFSISFADAVAPVATPPGNRAAGTPGTTPPGNRRRTPTRSPSIRSPTRGPIVIKGKLYFHNRDEVPVLQIPPGFSFEQEPVFYIHNQTGLKVLHVAQHPNATDGVGMGILRTTGAGRVFVDTSVVHEETEFFFGIRLTLEDLNFKNEDEDEVEGKDDGLKAETFGVESLNLDPDA